MEGWQLGAGVTTSKSYSEAGKPVLVTSWYRLVPAIAADHLRHMHTLNVTASVRDRK